MIIFQTFWKKHSCTNFFFKVSARLNKLDTIKLWTEARVTIQEIRNLSKYQVCPIFLKLCTVGKNLVSNSKNKILVQLCIFQKVWKILLALNYGHQISIVILKLSYNYLAKCLQHCQGSRIQCRRKTWNSGRIPQHKLLKRQIYLDLIRWSWKFFWCTQYLCCLHQSMALQRDH